MMGGTKSSAAVSAASAAGSRRAVAGTIAEAAAIARRAAEDGRSAADAAPVSSPPADDQERHTRAQPETTDDRADQSPMPVQECPPADSVLMRRSRAGAGQLKDASQEPDRTAVHLILAGRAYAYGKSIVHPDGSKKPGESVAIES
jgi:hypothetical protein